jgi:hypothetical protein
MPSNSPWRIPSGMKFRVLSVADAPPLALSDFSGDVSFTLDAGEEVYLVSGTGAPSPEYVRFFEKTPSGKDVRVWAVTKGEGIFEAEHAAAF